MPPDLRFPLTPTTMTRYLAAAFALLLSAACADTPAGNIGLDPVSRSADARPATVAIADIGSFNSTAPTALDINDAGQVAVRSRWGDGTFHSYIWSDREGAIDIGHGGGGSTGVNGINNRRWMAGWTTLAGMPSRQVPMIWSEADGFTLFLGDVPGRAFDITEAGAVVGSLGQNPAVSSAFLWSPGDGVTHIAGSPSIPSGAFDVNNRGDVAGWVRTSGCCVERAFRWSSAGGLQVLGTVGHSGGNSFALAQNDLGTVVGTYEVSQGSGAQNVHRGGPGVPRSIPMHAFVWTEKTGMVDIGTLPGHRHSQAWGVDDRGRVFGWSRAATGDPSRAFMWTEAAGMVDLGTLGGTISASGAINRHGQLAGWATTSGGEQRAVIFHIR